MHKATYHENELLDMARATENRAVRLRKAIEHNRLVREQSRAGNAPEPEPPSVGEEPEPYIEIGPYRFTRIDKFRRGVFARWCVCGTCAAFGYVTPELSPEVTPFYIWQECVRLGVPCPEPRTVGTWPKGCDNGAASQWAAIESIEPDGDGGAYIAGTRISRIRNFGPGPYSTARALHRRSRVHMDPAAIRAACAEKGVPCVGEPESCATCRYRRDRLSTAQPWYCRKHSRPLGSDSKPCDDWAPCAEKPKTVAVDTTPVVGKVAFAAVDTLFVAICQDGKPYLRIAGMADGTQREEWTRTPIADIRAQAEAAGIKLPPVTVKCSGWTWTRISAVTVEARSNDTLDTTIVGVSDSGTGNEFSLSSARTIPAQVCQLCKLAWWPKPQVRMVCTYCAGDACEIDPMLVDNVAYEELHYSHFTRVSIKYRDGRHYEYRVRESVAQVEAMRDACKGGE